MAALVWVAGFQLPPGGAEKQKPHRRAWQWGSKSASVNQNPAAARLFSSAFSDSRRFNV